MDGSQHLYAPPTGFAIGVVKDNADPQSRGRVQVTLPALQMDVWAPCIVPSAGSGYGVSMLPRQGEIVMVAFLTPDQPFVIGAVWSGSSSQPTEAAPVQDRYEIKTPYGNTILFDDNAQSFTVTTPHSNSLTITDSGDTCTIQVGTTSIQATTTGVTINTSASIELQTSAMTITATSINVNAPLTLFSGVVQCDTVIATTVVGTSYTPGAGNIW
jgi:uncharacterized protein involved in type VI secretion and phage assembly